ncbi:Metallo-dependent hydrolase [Mycena albidolilacea]|uniref:Metallo-dependent hydrolase n=1 Tax=Mycena albidolilacea TaxID=1033008 RepID=A0AAD7ARN0_9AGAR|nr:Metallo-dependent hydrolase [Mycena albidolilacea]
MFMATRRAPSILRKTDLALASRSARYSQHSVAGHAANALGSLTSAQISFIQKLPKAELHAHLNGSIPVPVILELARDHAASEDVSSGIQEGLKRLENVELKDLNEFFGLFPAIYALTSTPPALARAARGVLSEFLDGDTPQCTYLELRSTPRATSQMTRAEYVETVVTEVERYPEDKAALIVSVNRTMTEQEVEECIGIARALKAKGRRIVGIDLCGDPMGGDMNTFARHFADAKRDGLGVTLHIAETTANTSADTLRLLGFQPDRLGHATFLDDTAKTLVLKNKSCIEICLSSNLLCKTVSSLDQHHVRYYLAQQHPISICTDDTLPFQTSLIAEYALLLAPAPLGLGLSEAEVHRIAGMSMDNRMCRLMA